MVLPFFMPDGASQRRNNTVPAYLRPTTSVPTTTAGEANRFRNAQQSARPAQPDYLRVIAAQSASARQARPATQTGVAIPSYATNPASIESANRINERVSGVTQPRRETTTSNVAPVQVTPAPSGPVSATEPAPVEAIPEATPEAAPNAPAYNVYDDPFYQQALAGAQSEFNMDRINALAGMQYQQLPLQRQLQMRPEQAEAARRRLAGNFAARGMAGGRAGVLSRAEAEANAREIGARTSLREQIAELGRQFTSQFGAEGTDWLGTRRGMQAQQAALQSALQNRLAGLTTVG